MFIYDVMHKDKVYQSVCLELRALGIKYRLKKSQTSMSNPKEASTVNAKRGTTRIFKTPLSNLPLEVVNLEEGVVVYVPSFVSEAIDLLSENITQEGLFRKAGSQVRQRELINRVDSGVSLLSDKYNPIDVANSLKTFFRHLPEPLIPYCYHDLFVGCGILKSDREKALLMACLLLPVHHLNTLVYLMKFLNNVSRYERQNKMSVDNLSKVFGPNIMPLQETSMLAMQTRLDAHLSIVKTLIENAHKIGVLPENIAESYSSEFTGSTDIEMHASESHLYTKYKKKKHRSGSLTRMFSGLKKIVGKNTSPTESEPANRLDTSDPCLYSPTVKSAKKRKAESTSEISQIKKSIRDKSPFSKLRSHKHAARTNSEMRVGDKLDKNKKMRLSLDKLVNKGKNKISKNDSEKYKMNESACIERRWSSASNSCASPRQSVIERKDCPSLNSLLQESDEVRKLRIPQIYDDVFLNADVNLSDDNEEVPSGKEAIDNPTKTKRLRVSSKRRSLSTLWCDRARNNSPKHKALESPERLHELKIKRTESIDSGLPRYRHLNEDETEYVRVRESEYEDIKNRVSAIESRISQEFDHCVIKEPTLASVDSVQSEYEKTLEEASIGSTMSADQLAKQMSRELKIRKSAEQKIFRSPSARRIGTIRRRSQDKQPSMFADFSRMRLSRTTSWTDDSDSLAQSTPLMSRSTIFEPTQAVSSCSDETNARLEYLQEQLQSLISQTVEHTQTPLNDDSPNAFGSRFATAETPTSNNSALYRTPDTTKYFNHKMSELKRSAKRSNETESWRDGGKYFSSGGVCTPVPPQTGRASVAKLRTQNAGMVLAKAKLFDEPSGSRRFGNKLDLTSPPPVAPPRQKRKVHSPKNRRDSDNKQSPKTIVITEQKENEDLDNCKTPHIKKPLMVRTPRSAKIVRRPAVEIERTPMKAVPMVTPKQSPSHRSRYHQK